MDLSGLCNFRTTSRIWFSSRTPALFACLITLVRSELCGVNSCNELGYTYFPFVFRENIQISYVQTIASQSIHSLFATWSEILLLDLAMILVGIFLYTAVFICVVVFLVLRLNDEGFTFEDVKDTSSYNYNQLTIFVSIVMGEIVLFRTFLSPQSIFNSDTLSAIRVFLLSCLWPAWWARIAVLSGDPVIHRHHLLVRADLPAVCEWRDLDCCLTL